MKHQDTNLASSSWTELSDDELDSISAGVDGNDFVSGGEANDILRQPAARTSSSNNLKQMSLALHNCSDNY